MRIAIAIATIGRAAILRQTVPLMRAQTRAPDLFLIAAVNPSDVEGLAELVPGLEIVYSRASLTIQRNAALNALAGRCDVVVFFDDDFIPSTFFLEEVEAVFNARPDIAAVTGVLAADGINTAGISFEQADEIVQRMDARPRVTCTTAQPFSINHVYGCNMAMRTEAAVATKFDERLPLYSWQEDRDFSVRLRKFGDVVRTPALTGVHMGVKSGRMSGVKLGYSQVANPLYLLRKGTMRPLETALLIGRNLVANIVRSLRPEPWVDRAGRVRGNFMALIDAVRGRFTPERILEFSSAAR